MKPAVVVTLALVAALAVPLAANLSAGASTQANVNVRDTRFLHQPATSGTHVAFVYADDLWVARLDGTDVRRLTTDDGVESNPAFSPDGSLIAFSAQYDGNTDVYTVPAAGGVPTRLTWHPGADVVQGFTPDGRKVLFTSPRSVFTNRYTHLFTVPLDGGMPDRLPIPNAASGAYSPDARRIAYNPIAPRFEQWKQYRGGTVSRLWLFDFASQDVEKVPQPATRSNDVDGMWIGGTLYFRSDRAGEFNLFSFTPGAKDVKQLTTHQDFPILDAAAGGGKIVYAQAGYLHLFDPATSATRRIAIGVPSDLRETRARFVRGARWIRDAAVSPTGARAAFEFRGEIVTVPAEKGDVRNLTNSAGAHERSPAWSPDGTRLAYLSDASGEYEIYVAFHDGKGDIKKLKPGGAGFYSGLMWSPDSRKLAYTDNSQALFVIDVDSGAASKVAANKVYGPVTILTYGWSPDSRWLAYTANTQALAMTLSVYSVEQKKSFPITDGLAEVSEPVFDRSGKYLYLFGSTDAGPVLDWFAQSTTDNRRTRNVYLVVLANNVPSPLAKESDEEKPAEKKPAADGKPAAESAAAEPVRIDFEGIEYRILDLPIGAGDLSNLQAGAAGQLYYLRASADPPPPPDPQAQGPPGPPVQALHRFDLAKRADERILDQARAYYVTADGKKVMYRGRDSWSLVALPANGRINAADGRLAVDSIEVRIDPRAEWAQIFDEAWRINRDYFYAANMHGLNWRAMKEKYAAFLPEAASRSDVNLLLQWMSSELAVGHHRVGGGDRLETPRTVPGGLLGADYAIENGRYRFAKVFGGLNFNPALRAPLTEPGVNVRTGEYLIAVGGQDVRPPANVYSFFENTAGKIVELTVGPNADGTASRVVKVVPIANEAALRNRDWVEGNLKKVDAATGGRVAYVYVPNTAQPGYDYFKRYFYPQAHKDAVIVDERFNGGGQIADYYIDLLRRPLISYWNMRYGDDLKTPAASIQGPKVMIIDETAGSGGDLLPWMFRKFKLGPIVGQRTWGGLVGTLGFPVLMDGGSITAPNLAIWTPEEGWVVENEGVPPDIEVEQTPKDVIAGRDPQLERAIQVALEALKKEAPPKPSRPAYPERGKTLRGTAPRTTSGGA
ncbi:MAG TPA: PDZ domain-containing protein, partial [Vicinamibacterales bacterium]|nr:PDZ domain-containing protein [Vicinamibacterales bacterium]